ncbi:MAG: type II toxin-antitoxin system HicB family antitoxin [Planctomycetes bacterium]|nr:type II toxin-antitoxin system HicB family antitoxin [Planctomycetota bacterium]
MKNPNINYPFEIRPLSEDEGGGYSIAFPDLPGCWSDGATPEDAIDNGRDALRSWLTVAEEFGDDVPRPFSSVSGRFVQRVPRSLHAQLIAQAKAEGVSLNTLVVSLVAQGIGMRQASGQVRRRLRTPSSGRRRRRR